jgi:hypothetical protein
VTARGVGRINRSGVLVRSGWHTTREERLARPLDRGERYDVASEEQDWGPVEQHSQLALPGRDGQHVVPAVHEPRRQARDDDAAVLEDPAPETEGRDGAQRVVHVRAHGPAAQVGDQILGQESALTHGVLRVGHGARPRH